MSSYIRLFSMYFMAVFYIVAGVLHFIKPQFYLPIMPRYLPYHLELIYLSGLCEVICGLLLFSKRTQVLGAWLTIALLIAVYPANIQMTQDYFEKDHPQKYMVAGRLPLQFILIWWAYQYTTTTGHIKSH
ncbi:unnamed protein product [Adineta steineri]|uniref:DoxX family protein n=1 Tax=Adineta steineri TaxID=433720 RepID=A0A819CS11_9BILA|nr:unnamed protein product [Adineta steineri]